MAYGSSHSMRLNHRVIHTGFWAGLIISLASLYPAISLVAPLSIPGLNRPIANDLWHGVALMISAAVVGLVLFTMGLLAARRGGAETTLMGAKMGGVAGLLVGAVTFVFVASPLAAIYAYAGISGYVPNPEFLFPPHDILARYTEVMLHEPTEWLWLCLVFNGLIGLIGGGITGWRASQWPRSKRLPLDLHLANRQLPPRDWLGDDVAATKTAVTIGLVIGVFLALSEVSLFSDITNFVLLTAGGMNEENLVSVSFSLPWWVSLLLLAIAPITIYFVRQPHTRWSTRLGAVVTASNMVWVPLSLIVMRYLYLLLGLSPYLILHNVETWQLDPQVLVAQGVEFSAAELSQWSEQFRQLFASSAVKNTFFGTSAFIMPWLLLICGMTFLTLWAFLGTALFGWVVVWLRPTPVDKAAEVRRKMRQQPTETLPILHRLFLTTPNAYDVLAHLALETHKNKPVISELAAAYHTLGTSGNTTDQMRAGGRIIHILDQHPQWYWAKPIRNVYMAIHHMAEARTLEDILAIEQPADLTTDSLPAYIISMSQHVGQIIQELLKVEKVEDYRTKIIFLENSLKAIHNAQKELEINATDCGMTSPPEQPVMMAALAQWQTTILEVIQRMKGRAAISSMLKSNTCPLSAQVPLVYEVANNGLNVAQKIRFRVHEEDGYHLAQNGFGDVLIEFLPPGESREVSLNITPTNGLRRLRVAWDITYDDAVDANRKLEFADVVELTDPDRPFKRIFPIPYVTGTPLKSDEVFVGRDDVFSFIRENLLGTQQNNAIILHGQRRTGKTSVLYRLGKVMADTHYAVLIDMQGKPARGEAEFLYAIADDIIYTLEEHGLDVEYPERSDFDEAPEFFFRNRFLRGLHKHLGGKNLLLLFDEFEELQQRVQDGRLTPEIFTFLRNLIQHEEKVDFVFSGTHKLEQLGAEYWSVLFNIAVYKPITFLGPSEVRRLILEPVAKENIEYDALALKRMVNVTAGHPYFTQLILHEMIVYYNETERTYITVNDVDQVLDRIVARGEAHFKYIWAESSHEEQVILRALTELLVGSDGVTTKDLHKFLAERGYNWNDKWEDGLKSLEARDIVMSRTAKSPLYRFKVDIIRQWIDRTRPAL